MAGIRGPKGSRYQSQADLNLIPGRDRGHKIQLEVTPDAKAEKDPRTPQRLLELIKAKGRALSVLWNRNRPKVVSRDPVYDPYSYRLLYLPASL